MTQHRKRLKKLMQSIAIQRNDFKEKLHTMRNYDEWDYDTILNWVRQKGKYEQVRWDCDVVMSQLGKSVISGKWERVITSKNAAKWSTKVSCSICSTEGYTRYKYCPNCGATMDVK